MAGRALCPPLSTLSLSAPTAAKAEGGKGTAGEAGTLSIWERPLAALQAQAAPDLILPSSCVMASRLAEPVANETKRVSQLCYCSQSRRSTTRDAAFPIPR